MSLFHQVRRPIGLLEEVVEDADALGGVVGSGLDSLDVHGAFDFDFAAGGAVGDVARALHNVFED